MGRRLTKKSSFEPCHRFPHPCSPWHRSREGLKTQDAFLSPDETGRRTRTTLDQRHLCQGCSRKRTGEAQLGWGALFISLFGHTKREGPPGLRAHRTKGNNMTNWQYTKTEFYHYPEKTTLPGGVYQPSLIHNAFHALLSVRLRHPCLRAQRSKTMFCPSPHRPWPVIQRHKASQALSATCFN